MDLSIFPQQNTRLDGVIDAHLCLLNGCFSSRDHNIGFHWIVFPKTLGLGDLALPALLCHLNNMPATPSLHRVPATRQHLCPKELKSPQRQDLYSPQVKVQAPLCAHCIVYVIPILSDLTWDWKVKIYDKGLQMQVSIKHLSKN